MYKRTLERMTNHQRVASHSTKPFGTGRVEVLPPGARPLEAMYNSGLAHLELLEQQIKGAASQRGPGVRERQKDLAKRVRALQAFCVSVYQDVWAIAFVENAKAMLTPEMFSNIEQATQEAMDEQSPLKQRRNVGSWSDRGFVGGWVDPVVRKETIERLIERRRRKYVSLTGVPPTL